MNELKYSEILKHNQELKHNNEVGPYDILILSNIVVHQSKEIIEYSLRTDGVNANIFLGNYNNIVQDSSGCKNYNAVIIFLELCNIADGFQYKIELIDRYEIEEIALKVEAEIDLILENLENCPLVLFNKFSSLFFSSLNIKKNNLDLLECRLNSYLDSVNNSNFQLVDINKIIATTGVYNSYDSRYFYSSKAIYTIDFFKNYSKYVKPFFMSANGRSKKALIFDCDNTLWKGILGEDGFNGIDMSIDTKDGVIYSEVQSLAVLLSKKGVIIGLCSKNNYKDVNNVIESHPDMILKDKYIAIKKVNWLDKVTNIRKISKDLNIGLDSIIFIDDSPFEVNLVRSQLPELKVVKVPSKLHKYTEIMRNILGDFYNLTSSNEDESKTRIYKEQLKRHKIKKTFSNIDEYLSSLCLEISISENSNSIVDRISQISLKTNQFNLTTRRYTETDIYNTPTI
jgi:FkbH-like protein